jgi:thiol-disulfide isomerase/thioredoxin
MPRPKREILTMRWRGALALSLLLLLARAGSAAEHDIGAAETPRLGVFIPALPPQPAPPFSFADLAGNTVSLADFAGKLVVLNLWATWCAPCLREMPSLDRMQVRLGEDVLVLAISEDRGGNKVVEPFIEKLGLKSVKFYLDQKSGAELAFKVQGLPTSFVIDRQGNVLGRVEGGAEWDSPKLLDTLKSFLASDETIKASYRKVPP